MSSDTERAFIDAFEAHSDALFRHALFRISDRERAYDLTQETYLKAWDYLASGKEIQQYKSFLYRILHNLIIDEYRRKRGVSLDEMLEDEKMAPAIEARMASGSVLEKEVQLDAAALVPGVVVYHAGTRAADGAVVTAGGRVLAVRAVGASIAEARDLAYRAARLIGFEGAHFRTDIGASALSARPIGAPSS